MTEQALRASVEASVEKYGRSVTVMTQAWRLLDLFKELDRLRADVDELLDAGNWRAD